MKRLLILLDFLLVFAAVLHSPLLVTNNLCTLTTEPRERGTTVGSDIPSAKPEQEAVVAQAQLHSAYRVRAARYQANAMCDSLAEGALLTSREPKSRLRRCNRIAYRIDHSSQAAIYRFLNCTGRCCLHPS
jgi:hypothetical protein